MQNIENKNLRLKFREPAICASRGERRLLVWGELGQWMVVDDELLALCRAFSSAVTPEEAIESFANAQGKNPCAVAHEAMPVIEHLAERNILATPPLVDPTPTEEPLSIANLTINITNRCNLKCPWCYNPNSNKPEASVGDMVRWLTDGRDSLADDATLILLGGEPMLVADRTLEIIQQTSDFFGGEKLLSTNGTFFPEKIAHALARTGTTVQVSLDSPDRAEHDRWRGEGTFDKAVANARRFVDAGLRVVFSMVLLRGREEADIIERYFQLARSAGAAEVRFIPLRQIGGGTQYTDLAPDLIKAFSSLQQVVVSNKEYARMLGRDFFSILRESCRCSRMRDNCGLGRRVLFLDATGDIYPCPNWRDDVCRCGHISDTPLASLMETSPVLQKMRGDFHIANFSRCHQCPLRYWCAGDCRAEAESVGGPGAPSPYCRAQQTLIREMFWQLGQ